MVTMEEEQKSMHDILQEFLEQNKIYRFEGDAGVRNLERVVEALGYPGHDFRYGTPVESFLSDNPGAIDAIIEWIASMDTPEWIDEMETYLQCDS
jgi:hypothetical protein